VTRLLEQAAALFRAAELFVITGRGRDGRRFGLPIFAVIRVLAGLPTHARLGLFVEWPTRSNFNAILLGWGFTATAPNLPDTVPHDGFGLNQELDRAEGCSAFVVTYNVDGNFKQAGLIGTGLEVMAQSTGWQCLFSCSIPFGPIRNRFPV